MTSVGIEGQYPSVKMLQIRAVGDAYNGSVREKLPDHGVEVVLRSIVQGGSRLIEEKPCRFVEQGSGEGKPLLLSRGHDLFPMGRFVHARDEVFQTAEIQSFFNLGVTKSSRFFRIRDRIAQCPDRRKRSDNRIFSGVSEHGMIVSRDASGIL
jgi:hypothetical protein